MSLTTTDHNIRVAYDIPYLEMQNDAFPERHCGDLYLPENTANAPIALIIHGGGWNAMDKNSFAGVAEFFAMQGYAAFAINYRLISHAPYPACYQDCLAAAAFIANNEHELFQELKRDRLLVCGGSAGGHLAMMSGLTCTSIPIQAIINISGPCDLLARNSLEHYQERGFMLQVTSDDLQQASPINHVSKDAPPLLCIHSTTDELVLHAQSEAMLARYQACAAPAQLHSFAGKDKAHGIWPAGSGFPHDGPEGRMSKNLKHLIPELEAVLSDYLSSL